MRAKILSPILHLHAQLSSTGLFKLMENSIIKWKSDINSKPKLRTYKMFKTLFIAEDYLKLNTNRQQRSLMAQLRCGILPIRIETGICDPITCKLKKNEVNRTNLSVMY